MLPSDRGIWSEEKTYSDFLLIRKSSYCVIVSFSLWNLIYPSYFIYKSNNFLSTLCLLYFSSQKEFINVFCSFASEYCISEVWPYCIRVTFSVWGWSLGGLDNVIPPPSTSPTRYPTVCVPKAVGALAPVTSGFAPFSSTTHLPL